MFRSFLVTAIVSIVLASSTGCVSVKTPDTNVKVGITELKMPGSHESDTAATPYARPLRKVSEQQTKVARQLGKRDWEDVGEESAKWLSQVRELAGYAGTSHNPTLFRECCRQLQEQIHLVQQAAERRDVDRIQQAFDACNPPLTTLVQNFPLTRQTTVASPAPQQPTAPAPTGRPVQTVP